MTRSVHVVAASIVEREGKFLLVEERIGGAVMINQPAGHWEDGETLIDAARREALEETGWEVEPTDVLGFYDFKPPDLDYCFLRVAFIARAVTYHPQRKLDEGIVGPIWLTRDELLACRDRHRSPSVMRCVDDYLQGNAYPLSMIAHLSAEK
ncbi:MAG: NUDIX hydrolase [Stenotrophobium sp.]